MTAEPFDCFPACSSLRRAELLLNEPPHLGCRGLFLDERPTGRGERQRGALASLASLASLDDKQTVAVDSPTRLVRKVTRARRSVQSEGHFGSVVTDPLIFLGVIRHHGPPAVFVYDEP
jgi:hypothetical protein